MASPPTPTPPWAILLRIPRASGPPAVPPYSEFSIEHAAPPGITELALSSEYGRDRVILAADPSGVILVSCKFPKPTPPQAADGRGTTSKYVTFYILCDTLDDNLFLVPTPPQPVNNTSNVGLLVGPGENNFRNRMVVELIPGGGDGDSATLLCYWTGGGAKWVKKTVSYPGVLSSFPPWSTSRVFSYQQKIWWADLSLGLLYCDPFQDSPELRCVLLPLGEEVIHFHGDISKYRCINLSHGKLRFVKVSSRARTPKVIMWTLNPDNYSWTLDYEASFDKIWEDESFKMTGLPKKGPILAMIHPHAPEVVYFFLEKQLFGVDLHTSKVKECFAYESDTRLKKESSHSVVAWALPPSLIISSGVCTSVLKRICRTHGIVRWPYRKLVASEEVAAVVSEEESSDSLLSDAASGRMGEEEVRVAARALIAVCAKSPEVVCPFVRKVTPAAVVCYHDLELVSPGEPPKMGNLVVEHSGLNWSSTHSWRFAWRRSLQRPSPPPVQAAKGTASSKLGCCFGPTRMSRSSSSRTFGSTAIAATPQGPCLK